MMQSQPIDITGMYGTILLHEDAGGYVLVAVISFTVAVVITALCIVMSVTMTGTPVLADAFTDGSQSIISENAEIPTVDVESATNCGDVASTEENLTESALLSETEEKFDNPEYAEFSGGNDAEVVSEFSDNSVPAAQTEGNTVVYLDPNSGDDTNDGSSVENAVRTLVKAIKIANGGIIYLLNPIDINENLTLENVTLRPGRSNMSRMLYIRGDVTLQNIIINNTTPDDKPCQFSVDPIEVAGTLIIKDGTEIGPFPGKSCIYALPHSTVNLNGGEILGDKQNTVEYGGGIYAVESTVNVNGGIISGHSATYGGGIYAYNSSININGGQISENQSTYGGGICAIEYSNVSLKGGSIAGNKSGQGSGVYLDMSNLFMQEENGKSCQITQNTVTTEPSPQDMHGEGGGIFLIYSKAEIESGTIKKNTAIAAPDENGNIRGGLGGAISAKYSAVTIKGNAEICNNSAGYRGGAIYTEGTTNDSSLLNIEGGTISGNHVNGSGAGIFAICSSGNKNNMDVNISGGTITNNYIGTGENVEENAIVLMGWDPNLTKNTGFADLYLSDSPVITGSVTLADDYCATDRKNYSPLIYVGNSFNVNKPILVSPIHGDDPDTPAVIYANESIAGNYQSHFCSKEGSNRELVKKGATLKWVVKVNVRLRTFADITDFPVLNPEKSIYLIKGEKVSPNDVPEAAVIRGYVRTGWFNESGNTTWDPDSEITDNMIIREVWALVKPIVQVSADKEKGCPSSKIVLTAKATHVLDDKGITYSYQWYKDNQTLDGQTGGTLAVSEAGTYKVEVTATSQARATSKETASIVIPAFEHSYSWQSDKTNHWKHCSIGNEDTAQEAHQFDGWTVIKQASIGVEGEKERTCTVCGYKETATIPAIYIPSYPVTGIKVSPDTLTLNRKDETAQLTAEVIPSYADNTRVTWKSSDESVVTVDEKGKVTAVGNGTATITVTSVSGNYTATVAVTVKIPVEIEKISIEAEKETLTKLGESTELKVKIEPENADAQKLIWKSENEMIAAVDENGKVTAIGNGTAIITVTTEDGKNTASITITVKIPDEPVINKTKGFGRLKVRSVNQTKTSITLEWSKLDGVDGYLVYGNRCNTNTKTYKYQKLATITNGRTWTHKNLKKGTFYKYIVKAYKIVDGKKVVTDTSVSIHVITQGSKYGIAKSVSVTKIGNKKNVSKITLKKGKTAQITAKEMKKDKKIRHHRKLCYESCNTAIATVTPEGLIQAVGKGTCTIWVYAQNGVYVALTVTVK
ncbi:Bacterial Ig-like domain (group 2) [Blautia obeum]|uniref:Bacterial Ig-like domain (Group 2) n=2 Tax=Blautia obeum TaxID=40520 RepID=A0A174PS93_9FIRM|nr:Bacterial Ig-like domain (group 2) [Blautia obeum]